MVGDTPLLLVTLTADHGTSITTCANRVAALIEYSSGTKYVHVEGAGLFQVSEASAHLALKVLEQQQQGD